MKTRVEWYKFYFEKIFIKIRPEEQVAQAKLLEKGTEGEYREMFFK
jgi:hypothetical protein